MEKEKNQFAENNSENNDKKKKPNSTGPLSDETLENIQEITKEMYKHQRELTEGEIYKLQIDQQHDTQRVRNEALISQFQDDLKWIVGAMEAWIQPQFGTINKQLFEEIGISPERVESFQFCLNAIVHNILAQNNKETIEYLKKWIHEKGQDDIFAALSKYLPNAWSTCISAWGFYHYLVEVQTEIGLGSNSENKNRDMQHQHKLAANTLNNNCLKNFVELSETDIISRRNVDERFRATIEEIRQTVELIFAD